MIDFKCNLISIKIYIKIQIDIIKKIISNKKYLEIAKAN